VVYDHYSDKSSPSEEIEQLRKDEKNSREKSLPLPPGYYSYLGYLYYQVGNYSMAQDAFNRERSLFPESTTLMNRFTKVSSGNSNGNLKKSPAKR
jgi:hypothetical protein